MLTADFTQPRITARHLIIENAVMLLSNTSDVKNRVYDNRWSFLNSVEYPRVLVSTPLERVRRIISDIPLIIQRELTLRIEIKDKSSCTVEKDNFTRSLIFEHLLNEQQTLGYGCQLTFNTSYEEFNNIGSHNFNSWVLEYECLYETQNQTEQNLQDFLRAHGLFTLNEEQNKQQIIKVDLPQPQQ